MCDCSIRQLLQQCDELTNGQGRDPSTPSLLCWLRARVTSPCDQQRTVRFVSRRRHPPHLLRCFSGNSQGLAPDSSGEPLPVYSVASNLIRGQPLPDCLVLEGGRYPEHLPLHAGLRVLRIQEFRSGLLQFRCPIASVLEHAHNQPWRAVPACVQVAPEWGTAGTCQLRRQRVAETPHLFSE